MRFTIIIKLAEETDNLTNRRRKHTTLTPRDYAAQLPPARLAIYFY